MTQDEGGLAPLKVEWEDERRPAPTRGGGGGLKRSVKGEGAWWERPGKKMGCQKLKVEGGENA